MSRVELLKFIKENSINSAKHEYSLLFSEIKGRKLKGTRKKLLDDMLCASTCNPNMLRWVIGLKEWGQNSIYKMIKECKNFQNIIFVNEETNFLNKIKFSSNLYLEEYLEIFKINPAFCRYLINSLNHSQVLEYLEEVQSPSVPLNFIGDMLDTLGFADDCILEVVELWNNVPEFIDYIKLIIDKCKIYGVDIDYGISTLKKIIMSNEDMVEYVLSNINMPESNTTYFLEAVLLSKYNIAKKIYYCGNVDVNVDEDIVFRHACLNCNLPFVEWLFSVSDSIDIRYNNDSAFNNLTGFHFDCDSYSTANEILKLLATRCPEYKYDPCIGWTIFSPVENIISIYKNKEDPNKIKKYIKNAKINDICIICYEVKQKNVLRMCNIDHHLYCMECFVQCDTRTCMLCKHADNPMLLNYSNIKYMHIIYKLIIYFSIGIFICNFLSFIFEIY